MRRRREIRIMVENRDELKECLELIEKHYPVTWGNGDKPTSILNSFSCIPSQVELIVADYGLYYELPSELRESNAISVREFKKMLEEGV